MREDLTGPPVAIVTSATARRFWDGRNPIGRRVRFVGEQRWHTIVGVVADVRAYDLTKDVPDFIAGTVYVPQSLNGTMEDGRVPSDMTLALRTTLTGAQVGTLLRRLVATVSGEVVIGDVRPERSSRRRRCRAGGYDLAPDDDGRPGVVLGMISVYGVLSFLVSRQTRDLGIRVALGAQRRDVFWLVIREGATLSVAGIAIGIAGAIALTRWLSSELHGVSPTDPATYIAVAVMMSVVTLMACYVPTRRAMNVDPSIVLRDH